MAGLFFGQAETHAEDESLASSVLVKRQDAKSICRVAESLWKTVRREGLRHEE